MIAAIYIRSPRAPGVLVAVAGATFAVALFDLDISVIGEVPAGFPRPEWPGIEATDVLPLLGSAVGIALLTLSDTSALSRGFASRHGRQVDPNREIAALGIANLSVGMFRGFPVSASTTRTTVAEVTGGRSQLVGVVGAVLVFVLVTVGSGLVHDVPSAALAAVVIAAGIRLFDVASWHWLFRARRSEFLLSLTATIGVVVIGVLEGIIVATVLSLGVFIQRVWRPHDAVLGRIDGRKGYHDMVRHPHARQIPGLLLFRFDAPLFFANADHFVRRVRRGIDAADDPVRRVVVAAEPMSDIDTTGAEVLSRLLDELGEANITLVFAELKGPVKDRMRRYGLYERVGPRGFHSTVGRAVNAYVQESGVEWVDWEDVPEPPD